MKHTAIAALGKVGGPYAMVRGQTSHQTGLMLPRKSGDGITVGIEQDLPLHHCWRDAACSHILVNSNGESVQK